MISLKIKRKAKILFYKNLNLVLRLSRQIKRITEEVNYIWDTVYDDGEILILKEYTYRGQYYIKVIIRKIGTENVVRKIFDECYYTKYYCSNDISTVVNHDGGLPSS